MGAFSQEQQITSDNKEAFSVKMQDCFETGSIEFINELFSKTFFF